MAFEADCDASTMLDALHVARTAGPPVPAKWCSLLGAPSWWAVRGCQGEFTGGAWHPLAAAPSRSTGAETGTETGVGLSRRSPTCHGVARSAKPDGRSRKGASNSKLKTKNSKLSAASDRSSDQVRSFSSAVRSSLVVVNRSAGSFSRHRKMI